MLRFTLTILLACFAGMASAQSAADKLYNEGLRLQNTKTISSQNKAIGKFTSAKKLYDSAANKNKCDDAISRSNKIIKDLKKGPTPHPTPPTPTPTVKDDLIIIYAPDNVGDPSLQLSLDSLRLDWKGGQTALNVKTKETGWTANVVPSIDGTSFVIADKNSDSRSLNISYSTNYSTSPRTQTIEVRGVNNTKTIVIEQSGKPVILGVAKALLEFKSKGGKESIDIYSNSDQTERENNNLNWKVERKPDWVTIVGEEKKKKGGLFRAADNIGKDIGFIRVTASANDPSVITSVMKVVADPKDKGSSLRKGEIVISSGKEQVTIIVLQN